MFVKRYGDLRLSPTFKSDDAASAVRGLGKRGKTARETCVALRLQMAAEVESLARRAPRQNPSPLRGEGRVTGKRRPAAGGSPLAFVLASATQPARRPAFAGSPPLGYDSL